MERAFLIRVFIALALFIAVSARSNAQSGCTPNLFSYTCCGTNYVIVPPAYGTGPWAYAYSFNYCCGGSAYLPLYVGNCYYAFKNRPALLDQMLKRFPSETFLIAACSGDLVRLSSAAQSEPRTVQSTLGLDKKLHLE